MSSTLETERWWVILSDGELVDLVQQPTKPSIISYKADGWEKLSAEKVLPKTELFNKLMNRLREVLNG
jgi:hypothetical protein